MVSSKVRKAPIWLNRTKDLKVKPAIGTH